MATVMTAMVNRYTPSNVKDAWKDKEDNPFKGDEPVQLSV